MTQSTILFFTSTQVGGIEPEVNKWAEMNFVREEWTERLLC